MPPWVSIRPPPSRLGQQEVPQCGLAHIEAGGCRLANHHLYSLVAQLWHLMQSLLPPQQQPRQQPQLQPWPTTKVMCRFQAVLAAPGRQPPTLIVPGACLVS